MMNIHGGNAFPNGVRFFSDEYVSTAKRDKDGNIKTTKKKYLFNKLNKHISKIPFIRGLGIISNPVVLTIMIINLFIEKFRMNVLSLNVDLSILTYLSYFGVLYFIVMIIKNIKNVCKYHGAEHKVFNAYKNGKELTFENIIKESRIAKECGTNFGLLFMLIYLLFIFMFEINTALETNLGLFVSASIGYELRKIDAVFKPFEILGNKIQKYGTTLEQNYKEIEIALKAMKQLIT